MNSKTTAKNLPASSTAHKRGDPSNKRGEDHAKPDDTPNTDAGQAEGGRISPLDGRFEADHRPSR